MTARGLAESVLWPGLPGPQAGTPARRAGSVRRTISVDGFRPDGAHGDVVLHGRGRDLITDADEQTHVADVCTLDLRADFIGSQEVKEIAATPPINRLQTLVGVPSRSGFRATFAAALPGLDGSPLFTLLSEVPIVTSLSRHALIQNGSIDLRRSSRDPANRRRANLDLCAGWAQGSAMNQRLDADRTPILSAGMEAPPLADESDADALAWHEMPELQLLGFRRVRRIDVTATPEGYDVDAFFRDVYRDGSGTCFVVHEYSSELRVDAATMTITHALAQADVLPGPECSSAARSIERLVGDQVHGLASRVRSDFSGTSTCTHLNDHLSAIGALDVLIDTLTRSRPA